MEKKEAELILAENVLVLDTNGLNNLPLITAEIDRYYLTDELRESQSVYVYGNLHDKENSNLRFVDADYRCESFFVRYQNKYWYRDYLAEALLVRDALLCLYDNSEHMN